MNREKLKFVILRTLGNFFLLFSLFGMAATFGPAFYFEVIYRANLARNIQYVVVFSTPTPTEAPPLIISPTILPQQDLTPTQVPQLPSPTLMPSVTPTSAPNNTLFGQLTGGNKTQPIIPVSAQFGIVIPKIGANSEVVPNVDAGKPEAYLAALQKGVAHAAGSVFPGVAGNIYLFAHSTDSFWNVGRYNAVFYLLKELENGDEIDIFFKGVRHIYRVVNKLTVDPNATDYLTVPASSEQLTLQTCWPPGTTLKRLIVIAKPERDLTK